MKKKLSKKILVVVLFIVLFFILFILSSLSGLRYFIPHYFSVAGGPFSEKNYLVLFQNNNELRPTGGFISAYGILKFKNGMFRGLEVNDVFGEIDDHEYINAPYPQEQLLAGRFYEGYTFRDANYYANFPQSVTELMKMYRLTDTQTTFDGVIAVNSKVLEDMLEIVKEIEVWGLKFTPENTFELLEYSVHNIDHHDIEQIKERKGILGPLSSALIKKIAFSPLLWRDTSDMIVENLNEKHIQLHFFNSSLQKQMDKKGWSGIWPEPEGDFLAVVESNLAGMKSDRYIDRDVNYQLQIWEDPNEGDYTLTGNLTITMEHFGDYNVPISGPYSGYLRVYLPHGAKVKSANVTYKQENSSDYTILGTIVKLNPGNRQTIKYEIELPESLFNESSYHLDIVKQSGTINDNYSVVVEIPQGMTIQSDDFVTRENFAIWKNALYRDQSLDFTILPDELGPRVAYTEIRNLNDILLVFNERMASGILTDPLNITMEDMDITYPEKHDTITIKNISLDYRDLKLKIEGMTNQPEEFYSITIKSGYDVHGNAIQPAPKVITLVQRI
jgi:hypothetical protein